ncbi:MAG: hypothetical protein ACOC1H_04655 [Desulfosalsimonas sp.]
MRSLISVFKAQDLVLKGIATGVRIKFEPGVDIDIHAPEPGSNRAMAQIRIHRPDPEKKQIESGRICEQLRKKTTGVASIYPFKATKDIPRSFVYEAIVDLSKSPAYHETIFFADAESIEYPDTPDEPLAQEPDHEISKNAPSAAETAVRLLETVDAGMFRQALDQLNLPRTSNLRLALSRLQRSAIDEEELNAAARAEAARLASPADQMDFKKIQEMQTPVFLEPLIQLLELEYTQGGSGSS